MSYAIVFSSKTGNTALLAQTLQEQLPQADCCYFGAPDAAALATDTLYVGFWTDKGTADADTLDFLKQLRGKRVFLFGTAGFGGSAPYFEKILAATPMGHFGDSEKDLVGALLFLLNNEAAGFITGICLPVDGGFSAYSGV